MNKEEFLASKYNTKEESEVYELTFNKAMKDAEELAHIFAQTAVLKIRFKATVKEVIKPQQVMKSA